MAWRAHNLPAGAPSFLVPPALAASDSGVFLFGGITASGTSDSSLWELDLGSGQWLHRQAEGTPWVTAGHSLTFLRGSLVLLGALKRDSPPQALTALQPESEGQIDAVPSAALWTLQLGAAHLQWKRGALPAPLARWGHCAAAHEPSAMMLVHAGETASGLRDDVWQWDQLSALARRPDGSAQSSGWTQLSGGDSSGGLRPAARRDHSCAVLPARRQLLILGGAGATGEPMVDGVWRLDIEQRIWSPMEAVATPNAAAALSAALAVEPPMVGCGERALQMACRGVDGHGASGEGLTRRASTAARLRQFHAARGAWERLSLRPQASSGARLAPQLCPGPLSWAKAAAPPTCAASSRAWLIGTPISGDTGLAAAGESVVAQLWQLSVGADCGGCVRGACQPATGRCECDAGWAVRPLGGTPQPQPAHQHTARAPRVPHARVCMHACAHAHRALPVGHSPRSGRRLLRRRLCRRLRRVWLVRPTHTQLRVRSAVVRRRVRPAPVRQRVRRSSWGV